jgi:hypothetical protein
MCHFPTRALQQGEAYSITSSASVSNVGGTLMPSCFAVLALTTRLNLLACSIGRRLLAAKDFRFCAFKNLLLTRVIGWINVSYPEWPLTVNLNDGRTACPTVVVHFGRGCGVSARR